MNCIEARWGKINREERGNCGDHQWIYPDDRVIHWASHEVWIGVPQVQQQVVCSLRVAPCLDIEAGSPCSRASVRLIKESVQELDHQCKTQLWGDFVAPERCLRLARLGLSGVR
eukprot:1897701-Alexandrium_andersonii.AAC.1